MARVGFRYLLSGVVGSAIAELGYLTLGGGQSIEARGGVAIRSTVDLDAQFAAAGKLALKQAIDYSILYSAGSALDVAQNRQQIASSSSWRAFGLIAGYSAVAAVQAGFDSDYGEKKLDDALKIKKDFIKGAWSDGIGGFVHGAGDQFFYSYAPGGGFKGHLGSILGSGIAGSAQGFTNKLIGNQFDAIAEKTGNPHEKEGGWTKNFATAILMPPKEVVGMWGGHITQNIFLGKRWNADLGSFVDIDGDYAAWGRDFWKFFAKQLDEEAQQK